MVRIKPNIDGKGARPGFYDGPPPDPGTYRGVVKKMGLAKIANGDNAGADRIALLLEITEGKFKGAAVVHSLNVTEQGKGFVNVFLHALTDGSEKQKEAIEEWFWDLGYEVEDKEDGSFGQQFIFIGKPKFKPIGKPVAFVTSIEPYKGKPTARVDRFCVPSEIGSEDDPSESSSVPDDLSGLEGLTSDTTSAPVETPAAEEKPALASVPAAQDLDSDDDDPWS